VKFDRTWRIVGVVLSTSDHHNLAEGSTYCLYLASPSFLQELCREVLPPPADKATVHCWGIECGRPSNNCASSTWHGIEKRQRQMEVWWDELDFEHRYDIGWWHADAAKEWSGVVNVPLALALVAWWPGGLAVLFLLRKLIGRWRMKQFLRRRSRVDHSRSLARLLAC